MIHQMEELQPCSLDDVGTPILELFLKKDANGDMQQQGTVLTIPPELLSQAQSNMGILPPQATHYLNLLAACQHQNLMHNHWLGISPDRAVLASCSRNSTAETQKRRCFALWAL